VRADKNDADVVAIAYKKNNPNSFAKVFLRLCRGKNKQQQQSNEDPFQSLSLITSTFFPRENSANVFRVLLIP
jgi:hypothetical protein